MALPFLVAQPAASFVELDDWLITARNGIAIVHAPVEAHAAILAHAARRLHGNGRVAVHVAVGSPLFREVAALRKTTLATEPSEHADALVAGGPLAVCAALPAEGSWDAAVARALAASAPIVLVTTERTSGPVFEVGVTLAPTAKLRWLSAIAEAAQVELKADTLDALDAWWTEAQRARAPEAIALSADAEQLLACLALAERSLSVRATHTFAPTEALDELVAAGWCAVTAELVTLRRPAILPPPDPRLQRLVAMCLASASLEPDPWALARAAELFAAIGSIDEADRAIARATMAGAAIARELGERWFRAVAALGDVGGQALRVRAARRALQQGDAADAQRWCASATALGAENAEIDLLFARSHTRLGDLVSAKVCLDKAEERARATLPEADLLARIEAERAEIAYLGGDHEAAVGHASRALSLATAPATRLGARATIGKVLLARGTWALAEEHFAADALEAEAAGEATAALRARLNRAIAMLSQDGPARLDDARALFERVLEDGTTLQEERARAHALANLGLVAYRQRDYAASLAYWERAVRFPQALRGRLATAHTIGNLAELRLRLGLVDHADHILAFGKKLFATAASIPPRTSALFAWITAQIALARRDTDAARRAIEAALVDAESSGDRDYLESAHIVAVRVALEDGDRARVATAIFAAKSVALSPRARAELAIVTAAQLRALGEPALPTAHEALFLAQATGEDDLLLEIHSLLARLHRDAGEPDAAQSHARRAAFVRDQIAEDLPPDIRSAFLAKPEVVALARLDIPASPVAIPVPAVVVETPRAMIGEDPQMRALAVAIRKVARVNGTVLVSGESGTGKELVAEALHRGSERAHGPLVTVNCAALVETLLLSELFGHEKGAFTGAASRRRGRFEMADGGTIFLDEIGDVSPRTQVALLRVLQEKTFERVGGTTPIRADVRVVCATHRDLRAMVDRGAFREDLYYRLRGITLEVPPLRARLGDLPMIAAHLLARIAAERAEPTKHLAADALDLFARHRWPGNVRELENVLRAVSIFAETDAITAADVLANIPELRSTPSSVPTSLRPVLRTEPTNDDEEGILPDTESSATAVAYAQVRGGAVSLSDMKRQIERDCIARALVETKGNITRAAALLGMKRPRLSQLVKQYGLSTENP